MGCMGVKRWDGRGQGVVGTRAGEVKVVVGDQGVVRVKGCGWQGSRGGGSQGGRVMGGGKVKGWVVGKGW